MFLRPQSPARFFFAIAIPTLAAAAAAWQTKPPSEWTAADASELLAASPWVKSIRVTPSRPPTEAQLRDGGNMGQPTGVGWDGVEKAKTKITPEILYKDAPTTQLQAIPLTLRWESAMPVKVAELKSGVIEPPTLPGQGYVIAVYGVPGTYFKQDPEALGAPLRKNAFLRRAGKKDVFPDRAEVFQRQDGLVVVYRFPPTAELSEKDGSIAFTAQIGRIGVSTVFNAAAMVFGGKMEI